MLLFDVDLFSPCLEMESLRARYVDEMSVQRREADVRWQVRTANQVTFVPTDDRRSWLLPRTPRLLSRRGGALYYPEPILASPHLFSLPTTSKLRPAVF